MKKTLFAIVAIASLAVFSSELIAKPANGNGKKKSNGYVDPYKEGDINFNLGIGYGTYGIYGDMVIPPLSISGEYNVLVNKLPFSFGGILGYSKSEYLYSNYYGDDYGWEYSYLMFGLRGSFHWNEYIKVSNLDVYSGLLLGYNYVSYEEVGDVYGGYSADGSYLMYGFYAGARYFFTENIGAFLELGYGIAYVNAGISAKF